ncbi:MAG: class II aldolase/adducin family protein [Bacteroidales bacterium]
MKFSDRYKSERKEVARFMRRLYKHGLTTTSGGNISLMVSEKHIVITPSATDKGRMKWKEVAIVDLNGESKISELRPSIETGMHLEIYRRRGKGAIIHAHPVFATTFTALREKIDTTLTAEACAILGEPLFVPYALMGSENLAEITGEYIFKSDILLLENHGVLTFASTLLQAFDMIEVLETAAKMTVITRIMGKKRPLSKVKIDEIKNLFQ